ncbi:MAG: phage holin family protein [Candidatus Paceibacterota bacterium]|jgi:putative membrane protein
MKVILRIIIIALAIMALPYMLPGVAVSGFYAALIVALVLGVFNLIIRPVISLVTLPVNMITLGLFGLVINGAFFYFIPRFVPGFSVDGFFAAFVAGLIIAAVNWLVSKL